MVENKKLDFLKQKFQEDIINDIISKYNEPWRYYHTIEHVEDLLEKIKTTHYYKQDESKLVLQLACVFHDVIYYPWNIKINGKYALGKSNEELSAEYFDQVWQGYKSDLYWTVRDIIIATETHDIKEPIGKTFMALDMSILNESNWNKVLKWEEGIRKEYSFVSTEEYKKSRIDFLTKHCNSKNIEHLIEYVKEYKPRVAFYAGSFNPFHNGHLDIVNKAKQFFDKVVLLIGQNPSKPRIDNPNERIDSIFKKTTCEVKFFDGFLPNYLQTRNDEDVYLIRGFRNTEDIAYEQNNAKLMKDIWEDIKIIYLPSETKYHHVSSSAINALNVIKEGEGDKYIPNNLF